MTEVVGETHKRGRKPKKAAEKEENKASPKKEHHKIELKSKTPSKKASVNELIEELGGHEKKFKSASKRGKRLEEEEKEH